MAWWKRPTPHQLLEAAGFEAKLHHIPLIRLRRVPWMWVWGSGSPKWQAIYVVHWAWYMGKRHRWAVDFVDYSGAPPGTRSSVACRTFDEAWAVIIAHRLTDGEV